MTTNELRVGPGDWPSAIADTEGYQVVVAGPGTGKTEFLVRRVTHLIESEKARRDEIAVLCFSRRSAASLRRRVEAATGGNGIPLEVSTFHSLALRLGEELAGGPIPSPLTTPEQVNLVARVAAREDPADWPMTYRGILDSPAFATELADFLMRCSERLMTPEDLSLLAEARADWRGLPGLYERYLGELRNLGRTDYAVLITNTVASLEESGSEGVPARYRYVLVDEYQDTTPAQARLTTLLARVHGNLTVTGDPYQSIYSFRGAELRNIANFSDDHPGARRIVLTQSHRVPEQIMSAALRVVSSGSLPGAAGPVIPAPHTGRSEAYVFDQETAEAEWIAEQVQHAIVVEGVEPSKIAVLLRSKRELISELSRALDRRGVPHDPPQSRLVDHPAAVLVRDLVTVATLGGSLRNHSRSEAAVADRSMRRVLLGPLFAMAIGRERALTKTRLRTWEPWSRIVDERLPEAPGMAELLTETTWATQMTAADGFWHLWSKLDGLGPMVTDPDRTDWRRAWSSLAQALTRQAERDPSIDLSTYFAMTDEEDFEAEPMLTFQGEESRVALTTLHQAKGLEFDVVFISNASEGVFPDLRRSRRMLRPELLSPERTSDPGAQHLFQVQEEMRLAYTAMTRARNRVVWTATSAGADQSERRPSRFLLAAAGANLDEVGPPEDVDRDPVTLAEAETMLRRWLMDPFTSAVRRLASATTLARHAGTFWNPIRFAGVAAPGLDSPLLPETFSLSPSQADAYRTCPRRYALERRLRLGSSESPYLTFGLLIHEVLERSEGEIIGTDSRHNTLKRTMEILDETWQTADFGSPELNSAHLERARKTIKRLYENWPGKGAPVTLERHVQTTLGGVTWNGYIDRVEKREDGVAVVDYKTTATVPTVDDVSTSLQLSFYALAWDGDQDVVNAEFWYPRSSGKSVATRRLDLFRLAENRTQMEEITRAIQEENWAPRVGNHCSGCVFRRSCPAWPEGRGAFLP